MRPWTRVGGAADQPLDALSDAQCAGERVEGERGPVEEVRVGPSVERVERLADGHRFIRARLRVGETEADRGEPQRGAGDEDQDHRSLHVGGHAPF